MGKALTLTVLFLLSAGLEIEGRSVKYGNFQFQENRLDVFSYHGVIENGIQGTTDNVTKLKINALVEIANSKNYQFVLKLSDVKFFESLGSDSNYIELPKNDFALRLEKHSLKFEMGNGGIKKITPSTRSTQSDVLNVQRGILSMLQVRQVNEKNPEDLRIEDDVSGSCETAYIHITKPDQKNKYNLIEKVKDLSTCADHHNIRSTIDGNSYSNDGEDESKGSVYDSEFKCMYKFNLDGSGLHKVHCKEKFLARAFSSNQAGAYVFTSTKLKRISSTELSTIPSPYTDFYTTSIKFDHSPPVDKTTSGSNYRQKTINLLNELATDEFYESKPNSAERFFDLVISFRHLKVADINTIIGSVDLKKEEVRTFLFDALAQCGTATCLQVLFKTMDQSGMEKEAMKFLPFLAFIKDPNPEVIGLLNGLHQKTQHPSLILLITTLSYRMCKNHQGSCSDTGRIGQTMKDTENSLLSMLGNDCQTSNPMDQHKILYALKGIGNLGQPAKAIPLIMDCVQNAKHVNMSIAAIQAMRKMSLSTDVQYELMEMLADQNSDLEKRLQVFLLLMSRPSKEHVILARDIANDEKDSTQLRSFMNSYLRSVVGNKAPAHIRISKLIKEVLEEYPLDDFDPSPSRYSKAFLHSASFMNMAATVNGMTFFHPESFVPRSFSLNMTTHLFGFSVNAFEVNARMEGLERLIGKYMNNDGYFSTNYLKKVFQIPTRQRRSTETDDYKTIDEQVNMKQSSPQALVSFKMFGNEIQALTLDDLPFLNGKMDNVNIIHDLYEMTKGKRKVLKHNMLVMEISHMVPTMLGMPMKIALNGSAVITVDMNGKVDTKNLIFGPKAVTISGNLKPSVSLHASGKLSVECYGVSEIGTSFLGNVHFGKNFQGKVHYEEGKEIISELKADDQITDLLNISYNIFHESSLKKEQVRGIEKRAKGYLCSNNIFDTTSFMGCDICIQASFPNAFYNGTAPYFPLTGPFSVGVRNYPKDPKLTKYVLHIKKEDRIYTVSIGTPGATLERKYSLSVGLTRNNEGGLVGFTIGENRRGVLFDYVYDEETNEVRSTLSSNFTKSPIKLYTEFINRTDPTTLNRHVGTRWRFTHEKVHIQHDLFYKNTYEYWALGSKLEYAKGQTATIDLKIQYEPQVFDLVISHPSTDTKLLAKGKPMLPKLEGELNVTHAGQSMFDVYGMVDISKYEFVGTVTSKPEEAQINAKAKLDPAGKRFKLVSNFNGIPLNVESKLTSADSIHTLTNDMVVGEDKPRLVFNWDRNSLNTSFDIPGKVDSYWRNTFYREDAIIAITSLLSTKKGEESIIKYTLENTPDFSEACSRFEVPKYGSFGNCLNVYTSKTKQGFAYKQLSPKDQWATPFSFIRTDNANGMTNIKGNFMDYINVFYRRNKRELSMNLKAPYVTMNTHMNGGNSLNASLTFSNGTSSNILGFNYDLDDQPDEKTQSFQLSMNSVGRMLMRSSFNPKQSYGDSFLNTVKIMDPSDKPKYTLILKQKNSAGAPKGIENQDYTIVEFNGPSIHSFKTNMKNKMTIQGSKRKETNNDIVGTIRMAMFDPWSNTIAPLEDTLSLVMKPNGKMSLKLHNSNTMKQYSGAGKQMAMQYIGMMAQKAFGNVLGFDNTMVQKLARVMKTAMISYFSTTECNGDQVYERFIKGEFEKQDLMELLSALVKFPTSDAFKKILKDNKMIIDETMLAAFKKNQDKKVLDIVGGVINDIQTSPEMNTKNLKQFVQVLGNDKSFNIFEEEFFSFLQQLFNEINRIMNSKTEVDFNNLDLSFVTKHLPVKSRDQVKNTLKSIFEVLKTWKYNVEKTPQENFLHLMDEFEKVKAFDPLQLDFVNILAKSIIERSRLPKTIEDILKQFLKTLDHAELARKVSKFTLQSFKVPAPHKSYIDQLLNAKNLDEYLHTLANTIYQKGRISDQQKTMLKKFLDTRDKTIMITNIKEMLRSKYKVSETGLDLLETLITDGNLNSFKDLPSLYSVNFFPKLARKLLEKMKNLDLSAFLGKLNSLIKDQDVKNALQAVIDNKHNLNEIPANLLKLVLKKGGGDSPLSEMDQKILKEVNDISIKFLSIALGNERSPGKVLKNLIINYYGQVYSTAEKALPKSLKPVLKKMNSEIIPVLQQIDTKNLEDDATTTLFDLVDTLSKAIAQFVDTNFEKFMKEDFVNGIKELMQRIHTEDGKMTLWDIQMKYFKRIDEQFSFLIRLLGQFSNSEKNYFAEQFTLKDGKILYYKIYQSIWKGKVANKQNLKQLAALFEGLEQNALMQLSELTGNYSMYVSINKLAEFIKGLDEGEEITSILESIKEEPDLLFSNYTRAVISIINKEHTPGSIINQVLHFTKGLLFGENFMSAIIALNDGQSNALAFDAIHQQLKELLIAIGHTKIRDEVTINQQLDKYLPVMRQRLDRMFKNYKQGTEMYLGYLTKAKKIIQHGFDVAEKSLRDATEKEDSFDSMLLDFLVPSLDAINPLLRRYIPKQNNSEEVRAQIKAMCSINFTSPPFQCIFGEFIDSMNNAKKDQTFVDRLLEESENVVIEIVDKLVNDKTNEMQQLKVFIDDIRDSASTKQDNLLQKMVFRSSKSLEQFLRKTPEYEQLYYALITRGINITDSKGIFNMFVAGPLNKMTFSTSTKKLENAARVYLPMAVRETSRMLQNASTQVLYGIDEVKMSLAKNEFVTDPIGFILSFPEKVLLDISRNNLKEKKALMAVFKKFETNVKELHQKVLKEVGPYSGKLNKVSEKLLQLYREELSKLLDPVLKTLDSVDVKMEKDLADYMITSTGKQPFKSRLVTLTKKTRELRTKYVQIQKKYVSELKNKIREVLKNDKAFETFKNDKILKTVFASIDRKMLSKVLKTLNQDIEAILSNAFYPQLQILAASLDKTVCTIKKNLSHYYTIDVKGQTLTWEMPGMYQRYEQMMEQYNQMSTRVKSLIPKEINQNNIPTLQMMESLTTQYIESYPRQYISRIRNSAKNHNTQLVKSKAMFGQIAGTSPDQVFEQMMTKYQEELTRLSTLANKALQFTPPDDLETPVFRFLGLKTVESKDNIFQPISRTAYLFEKSLVTFDGKAIYLPKEVLGRYKDCKYLLTRDFQWKNFTVYLHKAKFVVEMKDGRVEIDRMNGNKVEVFVNQPSIYSTEKRHEEFPIQLAFSSVLKVQPNVLMIDSLVGFQVYCRLDVFACNVTVSGYYHNKTLGLFGTNNVENSDDLRMPRGGIASGILEFINAYELRRHKKCAIMDIAEVLPAAEDTKGKCSLFGSDNRNGNDVSITRKLADFSTRRSAFGDVCKNEPSNPLVHQAFTDSIHKEFGLLNDMLLSPTFDTCSLNTRNIRYTSTKNHKRTQIVILLKLIPSMKKVKSHLKRIVRRIQSDLKETDIQFSIVGYGGKGVRFHPHLQTGNGQVFTDVDGALTAINLIPFTGEEVSDRLGLRALKYASQIDYQPGSKIFLLFDNDATFTNSLREMIDVSGQLLSRGIILNTVNAYDMRRDIIGKDSYGRRYYVREPLGRDSPRTRFPKQDDYIPLVKQSRGAVFTLKAFLNGNSKWSKALPFSVSKVISLQSKTDQHQCKECACAKCKDVNNQQCEMKFMQ
ncbi:uncharacterized protein [Clytia hemisphaerica]|uniref:uncharacterized protein isoform X2 n=1 Tax=Clytia hemisphaerica TaxID=252671 RepID=UPI0034D5F521